MRVRKRDLTLVEFDEERIETALKKASQSVNEEVDTKELTQKVVACLTLEEIHIEQIQDQVEQTLMNAGHYHVLRHYITYRNEKQKQRDMGILNLKNLPDIQPPFKEIGYITYKRTYARDNEEFKDTILRVLIGCQKQLKVGFTNDELKIAYEHFMNLRGSVAGRFLWQLNTETVNRFGLMSLQNCAFCKVDSIRSFTFLKDVLMLGVGCGVNVQRHNVENLPPVLDEEIDIVRKDTKDADFIIPDSREGWVSFLERVLEAYFYKGRGFSYSTICIRSAGTPIIGFGGVASGPNILCEGIHEICKVLKKRRGQKLRPIDCMDIADIIGSIVVAGNVRRCLPQNTMIHTNDGMIPIQDISVGTHVLTSYGVYERVSAVYNQGWQQIVKIETEDGFFRCTPSHRMAVMGNNNRIRWKKAENLNKQDRLLTARNPILGQTTLLPVYEIPLTTSLGWFLGFFIHSSSPFFADTIQIAGAIRSNILKMEPLFSVRLDKLMDNRFMIVCESDTKKFFEYLTRHFPRRQVPDCIWKANVNVRKAFLAGVMDASSSCPIVCSCQTWAYSLQNLSYSVGIEMRMRHVGKKTQLSLPTLYAKQAFLKIQELCQRDKIQISFWEKWTQTDEWDFYHTSKVVRVIYEEQQELTYDITVEHEHNFYANGYLTHNSAILVMGDSDDHEYLHAKRWDLGNIPNYRAMSNNSVICNDIRELPEEFWEGYKGNGECYGLINLRLARQRGRLQDGNRYPDVVEGFNPCLTGDTRILTTNGIFPITKLIGHKFNVIVNGASFSSTDKGFWHTGKKPIFEIQLEHGMKVKATENHRFMTFEGWKKVRELNVDDDALLLSLGRIPWKGRGTEEDGYIIGFLAGNKVYYSSHIPMVSMLVPQHMSPDEFGPIQKIQTIYQERKNRIKHFTIGNQDLCYKQYNFSSFLFKELAHEYGLFTDDGKIQLYEQGSYDFTIGLLKGLFDSAGILYNNINNQTSIRLWEEDTEILYAVQRMLLAIGIVSKIIGYELLITGNDNMMLFKQMIHFSNNEKKQILDHYSGFAMLRKEYCVSKVVSITPCGQEDVYDCTIEDSHYFSANGIVSHNCAEQGLANFETCCLSEIFLPNIQNYDQLKSLALILYRICKHSLLLPCHHPETEKIVHDNMRMGIGVSGILQSSDTQLGWLNQLYEDLREFDLQYSEKLGVLPSIKLTTVKPSGTLSLLGGCTPGIHPALFRYYIRRIRIASTNPLVELCRKHHYHVEPQKNFDGTLDPKTMVVEFPCKSSDHAILSDDMTAIDQLEKVKELQTIYSDNAVSCTIYYNKEELPAIKEWLYENYNNHVKTCSFLLRYDHGFAQAPFEPITEEQYEQLIQKVLPIRHGITIALDDTDTQDECPNGICPIK